jgi:metal-dependent HD superfamily phosphatase/phosphodiesterase
MDINKEINETKIKVPADHNPLIKKAQDNINNNDEIKALWIVNNVNAIDRLGMTDHGHVHFQIVANIALKLGRLSNKAGEEYGIVKNYGLSVEHGELVIFLASLFHDLGISISRANHEEYSLFLANRLLHEVLDFLPIVERTIITSETLHSIISHRKGGEPYTLEAGIVRVADALDMTEGRSRTHSEDKQINIHALSHNAIKSVNITDGDQKPIKIDIKMNNSVGFFQVSELLKKKIKGTRLENIVYVVAQVDEVQEKSLIKEFVIE